MDKIKELQKRRAKTFTQGEVNPVFDKLPPQAVEFEEAVLGAIMLEKDALTNVVDILKPHMFYKEAHRFIYEGIIKLFERSDPVDVITVMNQMKQDTTLQAAGGAYYLNYLTSRVASSANVEYHARIIIQKSIQRELISISSETIKHAYDDTLDVFDMLDNAERGLYDIVQGNVRKNYDKMSTLTYKAIKQIEEARKKGDSLTGVPSGFSELDRVTAGWQPSDLVIVAARPGMGKTAFVLSLARNTAVDHSRPVAIFSLEMSAIQLVNRLIAAETEIDSEKLKKGQLTDTEWQIMNEKINRLSEAQIFIDDTPALSIFELRAKARRLVAQQKVEMIVVDYLQLMSGSTDGRYNREQEISNISRSLKSIAKELNIPIIGISQLSRAVETRGGDKRPQLSDLRESGAIEQDADMVVFIYRPEYYGLTEFEGGMPTKGIAEIIIAKHRNGSLKNIHLRFVDYLAKFVDLDGGFGKPSEYVHDTTISEREEEEGDNMENTIKPQSREKLGDTLRWMKKDEGDDKENPDHDVEEDEPF